MTKPVIVCDDTRSVVCEQRIRALQAGCRRQWHLNGCGSVVLFQVQEPVEVRVVVTCEREEAYKSTWIAVSAETLRSRDIPVGLSGEESLPVIREDNLDAPGRVPAFPGGWIPRNLLFVVIPLFDPHTL
jgi:hypothetical protein